MEFIPVTRVWSACLIMIAVLLVSCKTLEWQRVAASGKAEDRIMADISYLADDKLEGRGFGTKGEKLASDYIARRFDLVDLAPKGEQGTWFQSFTVKNPTPHGVEFSEGTDLGSSTGRNVMAYQDNGAPYTIILGGHYDHLGMGGMGSLHAGPPAIHNGADDNASGIAIILELAQRLKNVPKFNYLIIAFTGEENGLWGSNYYCDHPTIDLSKVTAMINFDMVGRLDQKTNKMAINGTGTSPEWNSLIDKSNLFNFNITKGESGIGPSDHTSFYLEDMPVLHFFTGAHEDYHKPSDDVALINATGIDLIATTVVKLIVEMDPSSKLPFTKTKDPDPSTTPTMEVTLGVLPDYLYDGAGMRIDGVRDGKPAQIAGLMKGDVLIKMAGKDLKDIYTYMEVLGTFHKGDKTTVVVLREGKEMEFSVQF